MVRRLLAVGLLAAAVAACGGSAATEAPTQPEPTATPAPASEAPSEAPASAPAADTTLTAACDAIGLRKTPSVTDGLLGRVSRGATVHVIDEVAGDSYTVGACGTSGATWLRIDQVNGKSVSTLYGVEEVYSAAGLYK
jgi:hypothetical protein